MEEERKSKQKTVSQAWKELIRGYDVINNLKILVVAFFGLFGIGKK